MTRKIRIADGGTGANNASDARDNLGLTIGTDVAAPNQDTTGTSGDTDALNSATTTIDVSSATAPTTGQVLTATSGTAATWQDAAGGGSSSTTLTRTAGEDISVGEPLRVAKSTVMFDIVGSGSSISGSISYDSTREGLAQSFLTTSAGIVATINCRLRKVGSPTGNLTAAIWDSTDVSGTALATSTNTISESGLTGSFARNSFIFSGFDFLDATTYYMTIETDSGISTSNYVEWGINTSGASYPNGQTWKRATGSTTLVTNVASWDFDIEVITQEDVDSAFLASGLTTADIKLLGFAKSTVSSGASIDIDTAGVTATQTGRALGQEYFLSDTPGVLGTTAGTVSKSVGMGISATEILIKNT